MEDHTRPNGVTEDRHHEERDQLHVNDGEEEEEDAGDEEELDVIWDAAMKCWYCPKTDKYYELNEETSA